MAFLGPLDVLVSAATGNKKRHAAAPPPAGGRRRMKRKRQKLVGWDKSSLTEQETEGTVTTTVQIRRKHNNESRDPDSRSPEQDPGAAPSQAASESPPRRPSPTGTPHDVTWHGIPGSVWSGGVSPHPPAVPLPGVWWKLTLSWTLSTPYSIPSTSCPGPPLSSWSPPLLLSPDIIPLVYGSSL